MAASGETEAAADYDKIFENSFRRGKWGNFAGIAEQLRGDSMMVGSLSARMMRSESGELRASGLAAQSCLKNQRFVRFARFAVPKSSYSPASAKPVGRTKDPRSNFQTAAHRLADRNVHSPYWPPLSVVPGSFFGSGGSLDSMVDRVFQPRLKPVLRASASSWNWS